MKNVFTGICMGSLLVMSTSHADVGREEELDEAVRQSLRRLKLSGRSAYADQMFIPRMTATCVFP